MTPLTIALLIASSSSIEAEALRNQVEQSRAKLQEGVVELVQTRRWASGGVRVRHITAQFLGTSYRFELHSDSETNRFRPAMNLDEGRPLAIYVTTQGHIRVAEPWDLATPYKVLDAEAAPLELFHPRAFGLPQRPDCHDDIDKRLGSDSEMVQIVDINGAVGIAHRIERFDLAPRVRYETVLEFSAGEGFGIRHYYFRTSYPDSPGYLYSSTGEISNQQFDGYWYPSRIERVDRFNGRFYWSDTIEVLGASFGPGLVDPAVFEWPSLGVKKGDEVHDRRKNRETSWLRWDGQNLKPAR